MHLVAKSSRVLFSRIKCNTLVSYDNISTLDIGRKHRISRSLLKTTDVKYCNEDHSFEVHLFTFTPLIS